MTVLLVGGTGVLGRAIAEELAHRSEPLRALVRSGRRTADLRRSGFELYVGDMCDRRACVRAAEGARAIISTAQGSPFKRRNSITRVDGYGNQTLISAAVEAGVEHFIFISALKADEGAERVAQLRYKYDAERSLQASGMRYTIVRPSSFQETFADAFAPFKRLIDRAGVGLVLGSGASRHSFVAVRDVARLAVGSLDHPSAHNSIVPIGGPDDLSYREAYARIAQITGRRVSVVTFPLPLLRMGGLIARPLLPDLHSFFDLFALFDRLGYTCTTPGWAIDVLGQQRTFDEAIGTFFS